MATHQFQILFNCTPAQFATAMSTTLPGAGLSVIQAPNKFNGLVKSAPFTFQGTLNTSTAVTAISSIAGLYPGIPVAAAGIPAGTTLTPTGATTGTLSVAALATGAVTITATPNLGQLDFAYDGAAFLRFFGANLIPVSQQAQAGIPQTQISANVTIALTTALGATLGAPVPLNSNNPSNAANA